MVRDTKPSEEQIAYAKLLDLGMKVGLALLILTFLIYLTGILSPYIPISELNKVWGLNVHHYLQVTGIKAGWAWVLHLGKGDFLNFIPLVLLASLTIICYLRILPIFFKKRDLLYGILALAQVAVLILAASGLLKVGGH